MWFERPYSEREANKDTTPMRNHTGRQIFWQVYMEGEDYPGNYNYNDEHCLPLAEMAQNSVT